MFVKTIDTYNIYIYDICHLASTLHPQPSPNLRGHQWSNQPTLCRFHRAPPHPPPAASPSPMASDVASDVEVSDADPSDVASDESMEPPEEDVPEELVAVAWLGRSSPIGSRYFLRDYVYIYISTIPFLGRKRQPASQQSAAGLMEMEAENTWTCWTGREEHSKYIATFFGSDSPS